MARGRAGGEDQDRVSIVIASEAKQSRRNRTRLLRRAQRASQ
jgi:hypothetical protein